MSSEIPREAIARCPNCAMYDRVFIFHVDRKCKHCGTQCEVKVNQHGYLVVMFKPPQSIEYINVTITVGENDEDVRNTKI